jgi:prepilin-type N-terminal cleavage/methylation domain-containing protein
MIAAGRRARGSDGLTLVELLIVIVVMGILSGVAVLVIGNNNGNARTCKVDFQLVVAAQDNFYGRHNRFATDIGELQAPPASPLPSAKPFIRVTPSSTAFAITTDTTGSVFVSVPGSASPLPTATTTKSCPV